MNQCPPRPSESEVFRRTDGLPTEVATEGIFPLSTMQESLWLTEQIAPGTTAYHLPEAWRIRGKLDVKALNRSINQVLVRHEALRTVFRVREQVPVQLILPYAPLRLTVEDASELQKDAAGLKERLEVVAQYPFDLRNGPLIRTHLLRLSSEEHVLLVVIHHIVSDEWSFGVFIKELAACYSAEVQGKEPGLSELPIQYADFCVWQRQRLSAETAKTDLAYWTNQLKGPIEALNLPYDFRRPTRQSFRGKTQFLEIAEPLARELKHLGRQNGATLYMVLLAAFQALLLRLAGQTDLIVGAPMANRQKTETEGLIGLFASLHALRVDLSGDPGFLELMSRAKEAVLQASAHQEVSIEMIVGALKPERDSSRHPLFQVVFGLQPGRSQLGCCMGGLELQPIDVDNGGAKFDWTVLATETPNGLRLRSEYCSDLFACSTIERWLGHWKELLQGIVANPTTKLSRLPLLTALQRSELITQRNSGWTESKPEQCVHEWFERRAGQMPEHIAVACGATTLTYRELNERANQVAAKLTQLGVEPEVRVALCLERSPEMVLAILAVLKAGGVYVPLDPATPTERLEFILKDSGAKVVLTQQNVVGSLPSTTATIICLDAPSSPCTGTYLVRPLVQPENTAYIIYTSGSTGRPKGVQVTHFNVVRLFQQTEKWFGFDEKDVWTLFHSYGFDFSVWEIWGALFYGGKLVVVPYLVSRAPEEFYEMVAREKVTVLNQTPSAFRQFIWAEQNARARRELKLRYVIFGGEALDLQTLGPWFELHGDELPRLINMYGITETTVHVTYRVIRRSDLERGYGSVIGVPIPDLRLYLLDAHLEPVPPGVTGEICVGGTGVARGYLNRPELTSERFVPDPYASTPGATMYRSGDLARYGNDGELEYLGRSDAQIKIRGFRVETGEIESMLNQHPGVRESAVRLLSGTNRESARLVAYYVPKDNQLSESELRTHLSRYLPIYMVPSAFVSLSALPLNHNGKLDMRGLPAPVEPAAQAPSVEFVAPGNATEHSMAGIWSQLLGRDNIGIHENFFQLGGHSLLATQAISRINASLALQLPVRAIFESPTIAGLAAFAQQHRIDSSEIDGPILPRSSAKHKDAPDVTLVTRRVDKDLLPQTR